MATPLILVGGFLGAGKTTLISSAAQILGNSGRKVGVITNDQAAELVDTTLLTQVGAGVEEVSGSCFCCNFNGFIQAARSLRQQGVDMILAEPVGSCTDLSATILQPIKRLYEGEFALAPLSVLVDPGRVREVLTDEHSGMHSDAKYILQLQLAEADRIVLNKSDTLSQANLQSLLELLHQEEPGTQIHVVSATLRTGVREWLDDIETENRVGQRIASVDYARYAAGEAALGWLNATLDVGGITTSARAKEYLRELTSVLEREMRSLASEIGHVKAVLVTPSGAQTMNWTRLSATPSLAADERLVSERVQLTLNARVQSPPSQLESIVRSVLSRRILTGATQTIRALTCFAPAPPSPTHRYDTVVNAAI